MKAEDAKKLTPKAKLAGRFKRGGAAPPGATPGAGAGGAAAGAGKADAPVLPAGSSRKLKGFPFGKK